MDQLESATATIDPCMARKSIYRYCNLNDYANAITADIAT